jgi:hypothetical protein
VDIYVSATERSLSGASKEASDEEFKLDVRSTYPTGNFPLAEQGLRAQSAIQCISSTSYFASTSVFSGTLVEILPSACATLGTTTIYREVIRSNPQIQPLAPGAVSRFWPEDFCWS